MTIKVSHITHIDNLTGILQQGCLWSDAKRIELNFVNQTIGYSHIKQRRLSHPVNVAAGGTIGEYVPFNFCPRSVMLYVIHRGHENYQDGQDRIVHLISDVDSIIQSNSQCFFTDIHADLAYAEQIGDLSRINELDFNRIHAKYWQDYKEEKQAEFLAYQSVPWNCVRQVGVKTSELAQEVTSIIATESHKPEIVVKPEWYY